MNQGIVETWDKLENVLSSKPSPLLRKPSRSSSPSHVQKKRTLRTDRDWNKLQERSHSPSITQSQNSSMMPDFSKQQLDLSVIKRKCPPSRPRTAPMRSSHKQVKAQLPFFLEGLTEVDVQLIYKARCEDSGIPELPEQLRRFYEFCFRNIRDRKFHMQKCCIGPRAAAVVAQLTRNNFCFSQLDLGKNMLTDKGGVLLVKTLSKAINLVHLGLSSNDISPEGAAVILRSLVGNQSITSFDISSHEGLNRNRLAARGCEPLAFLLKENHILSHLNLAGTAIGPEGLEFINVGFKGNRSILTLNLANNNLGGKAMEGFTRALVGSKLQHLNLSGNKLGAPGCEFIGRLLYGGFEGFCPLLNLDLSKNEIPQAGAGRIYSAMARNTTLKSLTLENNPLGPYSNLELYSFLAENRALIQLNLSYCDLRAEGVQQLGEGLMKNHALQSLNLAWNALEDKGAVNVASGIGRNDSLKTIDLSSNRIKDDGGNSLCECLKTNRMLEVMLLQDNNIHDSAGQLLSEITRYNRALLKIGLKFNPINQKYVNEINENISANRESQRKNVMPLLKSEIKRLTIREDAFLEIEAMEMKKKAEEEELRRQLKESEERFERFKDEEEAKFSLVRVKTEQVLQQKDAVGQDYESLEAEILVSFPQDEKLKGEKSIQDWDNRLAAVATDVHRAHKEGVFHIVTEIKQQFALKRIQATQQITMLQEQLQREISSKQMAEMSLQAFTNQIEQQKQEISKLENPAGVLSQRQEKTVLASEQLAVMKKQGRICHTGGPSTAADKPQTPPPGKKRAKSAKKR